MRELKPKGMNSFTVRAAAVISKYLRQAIETFAETRKNVSLLNQNKLISNNFIDLKSEAKFTEKQYFWLDWKEGIYVFVTFVKERLWREWIAKNVKTSTKQ